MRPLGVGWHSVKLMVDAFSAWLAWASLPSGWAVESICVACQGCSVSGMPWCTVCEKSSVQFHRAYSRPYVSWNGTDCTNYPKHLCTVSSLCLELRPRTETGDRRQETEEEGVSPRSLRARNVRSQESGVTRQEPGSIVSSWCLLFVSSQTAGVVSWCFLASLVTTQHCTVYTVCLCIQTQHYTDWLSPDTTLHSLSPYTTLYSTSPDITLYSLEYNKLPPRMTQPIGNNFHVCDVEANRFALNVFISTLIFQHFLNELKLRHSTSNISQWSVKSYNVVIQRMFHRKIKLPSQK